MSIAVVGQGFVGGSLTTVFSERGETVYVYDKAGKVSTGGINGFTRSITREVVYPGSIAEFVRECEGTSGFSGVFFVCVPTPMYEDGSPDVSIVEDVLELVCNAPYTSDSPQRIAVIKSTVPPGSTERWNKMFNDRGLHVVFNPEFLTEANAVNDMREQNRIVLGGPRPYINTVRNVFQRAFPKIPIIKTSSTTAEAVKYFTNIHLAVRVVLSCEFKQICDALDESGLNVDYDKVLEYARFDPRLGNSHMNVPGQDGIPGARGHCFPKDLNALISVAKEMSIKPTVMQAVWEKNLELIPPEHRDWEKMSGRAVSKKKS